MIEWWRKANDLFVANGLNTKDIKAMVHTAEYELRDGYVWYDHLC